MNSRVSDTSSVVPFIGFITKVLAHFIFMLMPGCFLMFTRFRSQGATVDELREAFPIPMGPPGAPVSLVFTPYMFLYIYSS